MRIFFFFVLWISGITLSGQQTIGLSFGGTRVDRGFSIKKTSDDHIVCVGMSQSSTPSMNMYVVKTDLDGNLVWEKTFGNDRNELGWHMEEADEGANYMICGFTLPSSGKGEAAVLMKITKDGNELWTRYLDNTTSERVTNMIRLQDGNFLLMGQTQDQVSRKINGLVIKINTDGDIIWKNKYGDGNYERLFYAIETPSKEIIFTGISRADSAAENSGLVMRISGEGKLLNQSLLSTIRNTTPHGFTAVSKKTYLITGYAQTQDIVDQRNIYMAMVDRKGKVKWEKTIEEINMISHGIGSCITENGNIIISGYTKPLTGGFWDGIVYGISSNGSLEWRKQFGGDLDDQPYDIREIKPGLLALTGLTESFGEGMTDLWLVMIDEHGHLLEGK